MLDYGAQSVLMKELEQLQGKIAQIDRARDRVQGTRGKLVDGTFEGREEYSIPLARSKSIREHRTVINNVDRIIGIIDEKTLPRLTNMRWEIEEKAEMLDEIQQLRLRGRISVAVLDELAERIVAPEPPKEAVVGKTSESVEPQATPVFPAEQVTPPRNFRV